MGRYLMTIAVILLLLLGGIAVDRLYRAFARRNPQLGPFREAGGGCGGHCGGGGCGGGECGTREG
ncbi:MAG: chemotaxis protein [Pseudomonadota bacterium]